MPSIKEMIKQQKKELSKDEYKNWLQKKLDQHEINRTRLIAVVTVVERSLGHLLSFGGSRRRRPYYRLFNEDGTRTRAWVHAAELALWLKYSGYKADPYVKAIVTYQEVRRFVDNKHSKHQIPLSLLFPSARKDTERLRNYARYYREWQFRH